MNLYLIGIDSKRANLSIREEVFNKRKRIVDFFNSSLLATPAVLSTCNRFEIYNFEYCNQEENKIDAFLKVFPEFLQYGYIKSNTEEVFRHLLRLACGAESQLKGEVQILEQLESFSERPGINLLLAALLREAICLAKEIRFNSGLSSGEFNVATAVFNDLKRNNPGKQALSIVIFGTGKVAELFAKNNHKGEELCFASRKNYMRAKTLAKSVRAEAVELKELPQRLIYADALISATSSPHFVLEEIDFISLALQRKKPLYVYDLSYPRDIKPAVGSINGIILKNLDGISLFFEEHNKNINQSLFLAEYLIEEALKGYNDRDQRKNIKSRHSA
jgi:glutamyl-tRNA reductase